MIPGMIPGQAGTQAPAEKKKPEIIGLEGLNLKDQFTMIDLRKTLEPGQGGFNFKYLGAMKLDGQYGPYYIIGVQDQNGNYFKFYSNSQLTRMLDEKKEPFDQVGNDFFIEMKMKPGTKYTTKSGEEREAKGYSYDLKKL